MDLVSAIEQRRSCRDFLDKAISPDLLKEVIRLGTLAPTACNRQAWRFIVVSDPKVRQGLCDAGGSLLIAKAPVGILVVYNEFTVNLRYPDHVQSASACIQNMLLAATSLGLGSCWINHLPDKAFIRRSLGVPLRYDIIAYVALGYPKEPLPLVPRKYSSEDDLISYDGFSMEREVEIRRTVAPWLLQLLLRFKNGPAPVRVLLDRVLKRFKLNGLFDIGHDQPE